MSSTPNTAGQCGLTFFGCMSASISHELKNALAIINEQAGLLEDLAYLLQKGGPVSPDRLQTLSGSILRQVKRADGIIKNMNRFAHSIDEPIKRVNLNDMLCFTASLSTRLASMKCVTLKTPSIENNLEIQTRPFFLENLIWICFKHIFNAREQPRDLNLSLENRESHAAICFQLEDETPTPIIFQNILEESGPILCLLHAELHENPENHLIYLMLPKKMDDGAMCTSIE
ncbi:MAG: histidine kinase dimerization/phospho-acceptor domain-containing protein [Desulfatirhabdiaceae bacterium]